MPWIEPLSSELDPAKPSDGGCSKSKTRSRMAAPGF